MDTVKDIFLESLPRLPLGAEMAQWDRLAIDFGIPETMLMEHAGRVAFTVATERFGPCADRVIWLFMGSGNNGGDAAVMARYIQDAGGHAVIFCTRPAESLGPGPSRHLRLALADGARFHQLPQGAPTLENLLALAPLPSLMVDALLGTGFRGTLKDSARELIHALNSISRRLSCPILAMDIPSGLNTDTGEPSPEAVRAQATITLAAAKRGLLLPEARAYTGEVICRSIGFPQAINDKCPSRWRLLNGRSLPAVKPEPAAAYKNVFGHVFVIGGAQGYAGAAHLAAAAALRSGAGLVTVCAPQASLAAVKGNWPEIMTLPVGTDDWPSPAPAQLLQTLAGADALVLGPGLGRGEAGLALIQLILASPQRPPAVVDADALALLGLCHISMETLLRPSDIITPHPGEAAMLLQRDPGDVQANRPKALDALCELTDAAVILKGAGTLLGQGPIPRLLCPYDIPQLAIGGAGDVLAGCAGGQLAQRHPLAATTLGKAGMAVLTHAMAALCLARSFVNRGFLASELANALPRANEFARAQAEPIEGLLPWPN